MPRAKRWPGVTQEDPPSKRGGRTATRRSNISNKRVRAHEEEAPVLRDALGLSPRRPDATADTAMQHRILFFMSPHALVGNT